MIHLIKLARAAGSCNTAAGLIETAISYAIDDKKPVRTKMLNEALALIDAVRDEINAETIARAAWLNDCLSPEAQDKIQ